MPSRRRRSGVGPVSERIARLLPLLRLVRAGRVFGEVESRSKFRTGDDGEPIRCTPQVDDLFVLRLARKGDLVGGGRYMVAPTDEGRAVLARDGSSS